MIRLLALVGAISTTVCAVNTIEREFTCPLDGNTFAQRIETSSQPNGLRLDLKRLGDVIEPPTVPQCPKCHLVLFTEKWNPALVARLKPFVLGPDFQLLAVKNPSYFCLAQIQEFLRAPAIYQGHSYLRASWQVEGKEGQRDRCLGLALDRFTTALSSIKTGDSEYANTMLLCGELERRLKRWDAAAARLRNLRDDVAIKEPSHRAVIERQLALIEKHDSAPQPATAQMGKALTPPSQRKKPRPASESPAPGSLEEASAAVVDAVATQGATKLDPALPPLFAGSDEEILELPELSSSPAHPPEEDSELLPEPRELKRSPASKPAQPRTPKVRPKHPAKAAVIAVPEGRKKNRTLIGLQ